VVGAQGGRDGRRGNWAATLRHPAVRGAVRGRAEGALQLPPDEGSARLHDSDNVRVRHGPPRSTARGPSRAWCQPSAANREAEQVFRNRVRFGVEHEMVVRSAGCGAAGDRLGRARQAEPGAAGVVRNNAGGGAWPGRPERRASELEATRSMLDQLHVTMRDQRSLDSAA
jgi:hypothetical protein